MIFVNCSCWVVGLLCFVQLLWFLLLGHIACICIDAVCCYTCRTFHVVSVGFEHQWAVRKRLNRSRCHSGRADSYGWLGSRVVSVLDSSAVGPGYKSQPWRCLVTVSGKLFTPIVPVFTKQPKSVAALTSPAGWLPRNGVPEPYAW